MADLKSNAEWKLWGRDDPLWAVASWKHKQKGVGSEWTDSEFYALGESDWQDFARHWQQYGVNRESCLEVGCGAGRITRQLALFFDRVYAVDVSEAMIAYARERVPAGIIEYSVINGFRLPHKDCSVKAIFSTHVLQHLDNVDVGLSYFREFYRVLDGGGTLMVHMPLYQWPRERSGAASVFRTINGSLSKIGDLRAYLKRMRGVKFMRYTAYPLPRLHSYLVNIGFHGVEFRVFPTLSNGDLHPFVLATK